MSRKTLIAALVLILLTTLVPPAFAADGIVFEDYFSRELARWDTLTCCWQIVGYEDGKLLRQKNDDAQGYLGNTRALIAERRFTTPSQIETRLRFAAPPRVSATKNELNRLGAGIIFGYQDAGNYYMFRLSGEDRAVLGKLSGGTWIPLKDGAVRDPVSPIAEDLAKAPWFKLGVAFDGDAITCSIDDKPVFTYQGDRAPLGQVGVTTFHSAADFAYLRVREK